MRVFRATFQSPLQLRGGALLRFTGYCDVYNKLSTDTHRQCRGEWKLARVTSAVSAMRVFRATFQSPLQLRDGALRLFTGYCDVYNKLSTDTHTGSVGASGSSPALRPPCPRCMCCGRPSSRPTATRWSIAVITRVLLVVYTGYALR